jgi:hypothetical protein
MSFFAVTLFAAPAVGASFADEPITKAAFQQQEATMRAVPTDDRIVRLPAPIADVAVGGSGRYLFLHLPKVHKLAVFDTKEAKVSHYLNTAGENIKFAAGMDKLIVVLVDTGLIQRWSLRTMEREVTAKLPIKGVVKSIAMGSASKGPLLVYWAAGTSALDRCTYEFLNVEDLKQLPIEVQPHGMMGTSYRDLMHVRASGDGTVFGTWSTSGSPQGLGAIVLAGEEAKTYYDHTSVGHVAPGPDGKVIYTGAGRYTPDLKSLDSMPGQRTPCLPAVEGAYYLTYSAATNPRIPPPARNRRAPEQKATLSVHMAGDSRPLATIADFPLTAEQPWGQSDFTVDKRLFFIPSAKLLVRIPSSNDQVVLRRFDMDQAMDKSGVDYLVVTSQPPQAAIRGTKLTYQLKVKSRKGGLAYRLESGPAGMKISKDGKLTWSVPNDTPDEMVDIIVSVRDSAGQEAFHTFTLAVKE